MSAAPSQLLATRNRWKRLKNCSRQSLTMWKNSASSPRSWGRPFEFFLFLLWREAVAMKHPFIIMFGGFLLQLANCQPAPICRVSKAFPNPIAIPIYWMVSRVICIARLSRSKGMGRCTQLTKRLNMQNAKATWRLCAQTYCLPGAIGFTSQGWREIIKHKLRHL